MEGRLDHVGDEGLAQPAETEARQRDAKLGGRDVGLQMRGDVLGQFGAGIALLDQGIELAAADFDHRELGGNEETVEQDEGQDTQESKDDDLRGIPVIRGKDDGRQSGGVLCRHRQNGSDERHRESQLPRARMAVKAGDAGARKSHESECATERVIGR